MPLNPDGSYQLPAGSLVNNGQQSNADQHNVPLQDIATVLGETLKRDGRTAWTGVQDAGNKRLKNVGAGTARADAASLIDVQDGARTFAQLSGTNTLTGSLAPALTAHVVGAVYTLKMAGAANTGAVTLKLNDLDAGAVVWPDGTALVEDDLPADAVFRVATAAVSPSVVFHLISVTRSSSPTFRDSITVTSDEAGAGGGPTLSLFRNSASPASADFLGIINFGGRNSTPATVTYGSIYTLLLDPTAGSEDSIVGIQTKVAGSVASPAYFGAGMVVGSPTGGDMGGGTVNAVALYQNGVAQKAMELVATLTASNSASLDWTTIDQTKYAGYHIVVDGIRPATNGASLQAQFSTDGGGTWISSGTYENVLFMFAATYAGSSSGTATAPTLASDINNGSGGTSGTIEVVCGGAKAHGLSLIGMFRHTIGDGNRWARCGSISNSTASLVNAVRFYMSSGNIAAGVLRIYGIPR